MVKLGSNLADKLDKEQSMDDGFDNIPLITPLEVNQLQQPYLDKVIVKTTTEYQLQQKKKKKLYVPGIKKLNIKLYDEVSEKVKVKTYLGASSVFTEVLLGMVIFMVVCVFQLTGLILITLGFLACLLLLVMYKALWYDQLTCPDGFILKHKHCTPAAVLEPWYYTEQQQQQEDPGVPPRSSSLYTALGHLNQAKRAAAGGIIPELPPSPWFPIINALKQAERAKEEASRSKE
uniref:Calcyon neuron-specific vesicular protein n=1 Tax=Hucho hucho TaxID=62062 RepID=A0A4W5NQG2_9TELE